MTPLWVILSNFTSIRLFVHYLELITMLWVNYAFEVITEIAPNI